jgi:hypothetical protein
MKGFFFAEKNEMKRPKTKSKEEKRDRSTEKKRKREIRPKSGRAHSSLLSSPFFF